MYKTNKETNKQIHLTNFSLFFIYILRSVCAGQKTSYDMEKETKCGIYKFFVDDFCLQYNILKPIQKLYKICISKIVYHPTTC